MPTLSDDEKNCLTSIVFPTAKTRLNLLGKDNRYATIENRRSSWEHERTVWNAFLKELLDQEISGRNSFPYNIRTLLPHIEFNKGTLYTDFPPSARKKEEVASS